MLASSASWTSSITSTTPDPAAASRSSSAAATNSRWWVPPVPRGVPPERALDLGPEDVVQAVEQRGCRRQRSASASSTGAYGQAPSTGPPPRSRPACARPRRRFRCRRAGRSSPTPAGPATNSTRPCPCCTAASSRRDALHLGVPADQLDAGGRGPVRADCSSASRPSRAGPAPAALGAMPSSVRSARSKRSNWRSAARRSPPPASADMIARLGLLVRRLGRGQLLPPTGQLVEGRGAAASALRRFSAQGSYGSWGRRSPRYASAAFPAAVPSRAASAASARAWNTAASTSTGSSGKRATVSPSRTSARGEPSERRA